MGNETVDLTQIRWNWVFERTNIQYWDLIWAFIEWIKNYSWAFIKTEKVKIVFTRINPKTKNNYKIEEKQTEKNMWWHQLNRK